MWIYTMWTKFLNTLKYLPAFLLPVIFVYALFSHFHDGSVLMLFCLSVIVIIQFVSRLFR